jgi:hypothetical protein
LLRQRPCCFCRLTVLRHRRLRSHLHNQTGTPATPSTAPSNGSSPKPPKQRCGRCMDGQVAELWERYLSDLACTVALSQVSPRERGKRNCSVLISADLLSTLSRHLGNLGLGAVGNEELTEQWLVPRMWQRTVLCLARAGCLAYPFRIVALPRRL